MDLDTLTACDDMGGADPDDVSSLKRMLDEALEYLRSFSWCPSIKESYLGFAIPDIVAVFAFHVEPKAGGTDDWLWVVVGDLPSAYIVTDDALDAAGALSVYCNLMEQWAAAVGASRPLDDVFPVAAAATRENADMLLSRVQFIREEILPQLPLSD